MLVAAQAPHQTRSDAEPLRWLPRYLRWYGLALRQGLGRHHKGAVGLR